MKIATSTVSREGYGDFSKFRLRWEAFKTALRDSKSKGVELLCLPGGYFGVISPAQFETVENDITREAEKERISVAVGIDCTEGHSSGRKTKARPDWDRLVKLEKLPSFAALWAPKQQVSWRQRSVTRRDQWLAPEKACRRSQTLLISDKRIEIITCGDIFNKRIQDAILTRSPKLNAVVDLSHDGKGFRADSALERLAREGKAYSFCCTHADMKGAMKRAFEPGGRKISTRATDVLIPGPPRIEIRIWSI